VNIAKITLKIAIPNEPIPKIIAKISIINYGNYGNLDIKSQ